MPTLLTASSSPGLITTSTTGSSSNGTYSSTDSSILSSQDHTNMTATNVVDSTSHLSQIVSAPSSPIIESTTTLSPNDNVW